MDDPSLLVATYEGDHQNHTTSHVDIFKPNGSSGSSTETPELQAPVSCQKVDPTIESTELDHEVLVEQMASFLTRNQAFTDAIAAAITTRLLDEVAS